MPHLTKEQLAEINEYGVDGQTCEFHRMAAELLLLRELCGHAAGALRMFDHTRDSRLEHDLRAAAVGQYDGQTDTGKDIEAPPVPGAIHWLAEKLLGLNKQARNMANLTMAEIEALTLRLTITGEAWEKAGFPIFQADEQQREE